MFLCRQWIIIGLFVAPLALAGEENESAHSFLENQGLRRVGANYVLPGERELSLGLDALAPWQRKLTAAARKVQAFDRVIETGNERITAAVAERRRLAAMLMSNIPLDRKVEVAARILELEDRIELLKGGIKPSKEYLQTKKQMQDLTDQYGSELSLLRSGVRDTLARYEVLSVDEEVCRALAEVGEIRGQQAMLGPRQVFMHNIERLGRLEDAVFITNIPLRIEGDLYWIETLVGDHNVVEMVFDPRVKLVCLPRLQASRCGLTVGPVDPEVRMQYPGREPIEGNLVFIDSLQVGKFLVKDVSCVVLDSSVVDAQAILGANFLRGFDYAVDAENGTLRLTKKQDIP